MKIRPSKQHRKLAAFLFIISAIVLLLQFGTIDEQVFHTPEELENQPAESTLIDEDTKMFKINLEKLPPSFDLDNHRKEQADLLELLSLCHNGDKHGNAFMLTKNYYVGNEKNNLNDIYINSCYPIEISTSQGGRSMGHCSDFMLFVYYAGARLNPLFDKNTHSKHIKNCPNSIYLHGEYPIDELFEMNQRNYWMPNVEQVRVEQAHFIAKTHRFLAKTLKAVNVLQDYLEKHELHIPIEYSAHSSPDAFFQLNNTKIERSFDTFYHGHGVSGLKATKQLIQCWKENPQFPMLTIVGNAEPQEVDNLKYYSKLSISEIRKVQYLNGIHICPSIREGFGHYINEARALGSFLITTDYGPMNEFVDDRSGLRVDYEEIVHEEHQLFGDIQVQVSSNNICDAVKKTLDIHPQIRAFMGQNGRENYERDYTKMVASKEKTKKEALKYFYSHADIVPSFEQMEIEIHSKFKSVLKSYGIEAKSIGQKKKV